MEKYKNTQKQINHILDLAKRSPHLLHKDSPTWKELLNLFQITNEIHGYNIHKVAHSNREVVGPLFIEGFYPENEVVESDDILLVNPQNHLFRNKKFWTNQALQDVYSIVVNKGNVDELVWVANQLLEKAPDRSVFIVADPIISGKFNQEELVNVNNEILKYTEKGDLNVFNTLPFFEFFFKLADLGKEAEASSDVATDFIVKFFYDKLFASGKISTIVCCDQQNYQFDQIIDKYEINMFKYAL